MGKREEGRPGFWDRIWHRSGKKETETPEVESARKQLDFIAAMAHEMRTQINAIMGTDELILRDFDDPVLQKYAGTIRTSAGALSVMVNEVLDYTKLNAGKAELVLSDYRLSTMLIETVNVVYPELKRKGLELKTKVDPAIPSVLKGDSLRLKQCILNILTNAVKYTMEGSVTLSAELVGMNQKPVNGDTLRLRITVRDTGVGMTGEDLEKLFSPFERSKEALVRQIEGSGLGMSIVQKNLEIMGSKVEVESEHGKGSVFSFTVKQEVVDAAPVADFDKILQDALCMEKDPRDILTLKAPNARILAVDDTEINLNILVRLLRDTGIQMDTASGGEMALEKTRQEEYDLLLIDHLMPVMDGIELLKTLRSEGDNPNCKKPCIALSGNGVETDLKEYREAGFDDFLAKPVEVVKLYLMLNRYLPKDKIAYTAD